ncbi:hypothetical protein PVAP13_9KG492052 [Panicum virgatum]|uniref:Uncharacterized protein n=1 Tax=Panicum virgatum TaxID=38727 RepID=A0A8T0NVW9_PANVG|nr:hypothetical protein PVAP13_9KG492052 [Panicum virgatum]
MASPIPPPAASGGGRDPSAAARPSPRDGGASPDRTERPPARAGSERRASFLRRRAGARALSVRCAVASHICQRPNRRDSDPPPSARFFLSFPFRRLRTPWLAGARAFRSIDRSPSSRPAFFASSGERGAGPSGSIRHRRR